MNDKKLFELVKDSCLSEGIKVFVQDIEKSRDASDTINVMPLIDQGTGNVLSSQTDQMLKQQGYVAGLNWVLGCIKHYQETNYEEEDTDAL